MSDREKKLLLLLGLAAFAILNVFGISWFRKQRDTLAARVIEAEGGVMMAEAYSAKYDTVVAEMEWLAGHRPQPRAGQIVATELEQYASNQATTHQLTVKRRAIKPVDESGRHFHRAKVEFNVTGKEDSLYRWLDRLQMPDQFKAITFLRLSPDAKDDTLIDCTVEVEQWYAPLSAAAADEAAVESAAPAGIPAPPVPPVVPPLPGIPPAPAQP